MTPREKILSAAARFENDIDQMYQDRIWDLSMELGMEEDEVELIWDEYQ